MNNINQIRTLFDDMKEKNIITEQQVVSLSLSLSDVYINLTRPLIVTLVGTFSSGKTAFINAIIKERILPERFTPCTGIVCKIGYCDSHLKIQYIEDGITIKKEIDIEELKGFVDIGNPAYIQRKPGDVVEIFHKNDFCANDIVLVDTPGTNDPNFQDDATNMALKKADAVIYCMPANQAYSETDVEKIKDLHHKKIDAIFYVIGFMDMMYGDGNASIDEIDSYKCSVIKKLAMETSLHEDGVFFVSATEELNKIYKKECRVKDENFDNGIDNVRIKIWDYLQRNRIPIKIANAQNNLNKIETDLGNMIRVVLEKKQSSINICEKQILLRDRNKADAQRCIEAISQRCTKYEENVYSFVKAQIESELLGIIDNIDKWVDEAFDSTSFISLMGLNNDRLQEVINEIQNKCTTKIQKAIEERIVPYINTSTKTLNREIYHLVERYIIDVNIDNYPIDTSVSLHLAVKESPLSSNIEPLPLIATLLMLKESSVAVTAFVFNTIGGILAALGIGLGWRLLQKERIKKKIISCIKNQLNSYSLISKYVQSIMAEIHWKEDVAKTITPLNNIVNEYENDIIRFNSEKSELIVEVNKIIELENRKKNVFATMNMQLSENSRKN